MHEHTTEIPPLEHHSGPFTYSVNQLLLSIYCVSDPKLGKVGFKKNSFKIQIPMGELNSRVLSVIHILVGI